MSRCSQAFAEFLSGYTAAFLFATASKGPAFNRETRRPSTSTWAKPATSTPKWGPEGCESLVQLSPTLYVVRLVPSDPCLPPFQQARPASGRLLRDPVGVRLPSLFRCHPLTQRLVALEFLNGFWMLPCSPHCTWLSGATRIAEAFWLSKPSFGHW